MSESCGSYAPDGCATRRPQASVVPTHGIAQSRVNGAIASARWKFCQRRFPSLSDRFERRRHVRPFFDECSILRGSGNCGYQLPR